MLTAKDKVKNLKLNHVHKIYSNTETLYLTKKFQRMNSHSGLDRVNVIFV